MENISFGEAHEQFIADCRAGIALNKYGQRYTKKSIKNLDSSLNRLPSSIKDKYLDEITDPDFQGVTGSRSGKTSAWSR